MPWYAASQPYLFPPLYIAERMARVHTWVVMEDAQFDRSTVRVGLRVNGSAVNCTPSLQAGRVPYDQVRLMDGRFVEKLRRTTQMTYGRLEPYRALRGDWERWLEDNAAERDLNALCLSSCRFLKDQLGLRTNLASSRELSHHRLPDASRWIADMGSMLLAGNYLTGMTGVLAYLDREPFKAYGIQVWAQELTPTLATGLSTLDALFRHGPEAVREMIGAARPVGQADTTRRV